MWKVNVLVDFYVSVQTVTWRFLLLLEHFLVPRILL